MSIFDKKPYKSVVCGSGAFTLDFYVDEKHPTDKSKNYLHITTPSGAFEQIVRNYAYGYLLIAAEKGNIRELEAYCLMLYRVSDEVYQDLGFASDIIKAINKRDKRLMREGASKAKSVTPEQEQGDMALMSDVAAFADATPKERKQMRKQWKEDAREALREDSE